MGKRLLLGFIVGTALATAPMPGQAGGLYTVAPFQGNDTGGIISWSPVSHRHRHEIAGDHCAQYGKLHRITSVHAWYGDYIGFACYWPRGTGGVVVIRRAY